jgi:hypothetical protein
MQIEVNIFAPRRAKGIEKKTKELNLESRLIPTREAAPCISWFKLCYSHVFLLSIELIHTINKKLHCECVA